MTKKDYKRVARGLNSAFKRNDLSKEQEKSIFLEMARDLKAQNHRFDYHKFAEAVFEGLEKPFEDVLRII